MRTDVGGSVGGDGGVRRIAVLGAECTGKSQLCGEIARSLPGITFNEVLRNMYGDVGRKLVEETDVVGKVAKNLGLKHEPPKEEGGGRF